MAELLGAVASGMTVAGLFRVCIEAFDLIQSTRRARKDFEKLLLRLRIEQCRLYTWGQAMGLTQPSSLGEPRAVEVPQLETVVKETLDMILRLFQDSEQIRTRYGGEKQRIVSATATASMEHKRKTISDPIEHLAESFSNFQFFDAEPRSSRSLLNRTRWVIRDKAKFETLISDVKSFVDSLQNLTKMIFAVSRQRGMLRHNLEQIDDMGTLEILSQICEADYPDLADAASVKIDVLTVGTSRKREIEEWIEDTRQAPMEEQQDRALQRATKPPPGGMSQQKLNQIVLDYLSEKGYTETEAVLRVESDALNTFLDLR